MLLNFEITFKHYILLNITTVLSQIKVSQKLKSNEFKTRNDKLNY